MISRAHLLAASAIWILAGFLFPALAPLTARLSEGLHRGLMSAAGMPDELAFRVAFTVFRLPVTAVFGILVAGLQCVVMRDVRPLARRWIVAAVLGACIATLIFLPSSLVALQVAGNALDDALRIWGAALLGGLVSYLQCRAVRGEVVLPGQFVAASVSASVLGVLVRIGMG